MEKLNPKLKEILSRHPGAMKPAVARESEQEERRSKTDLLTDDQHLARVLEKTGDDPKLIHNAVEASVRSVSSKARRTYLRTTLGKRALERIKQAREKASA